ncbi:D-2-hydroxyacid dehydrogenase [Eubacteriales bacterium OttesenSCG-928-K08]|nr:D-2-hydroxyacid dehydrogenase [Eubacteriales bacterium OttesenSCG-928-K08]
MERLALVKIPTTEELREKMRAAAPELTFQFIERGEDYLEYYERAEIAFGSFQPKKLPYPQKLKWMQVLSAGVERYIAPGALPQDAVLTSASGSYGVTISEFMLAQTLALYNRLHIYRDNQNKSLWKPTSYNEQINGKTVLILGLGNLGLNYARLMRALGAYTIGVRRSDPSRPAYVDELFFFDDPELESQFTRADIIAMCMPGTAQTANTLCAKRIALLKPTAIVINVGRGSAIDEKALAYALKERRIQGAALDVFQEEPLPETSPLWGLENALLTPHIAGGDYAPQVLQTTTALFLENLAAYRTNSPLKNAVDRSLGYSVGREK